MKKNVETDENVRRRYADEHVVVVGEYPTLVFDLDDDQREILTYREDSDEEGETREPALRG